MPSYYGDPNTLPPTQFDMPVLRIPATAPVRVAMPAGRGGASGGANLGQAIDMKKIMALLNQKWGAGAGGDPDPDAPYLQGAAVLDAASAPPVATDPDPDLFYLPKTGGI